MNESVEFLRVSQIAQDLVAENKHIVFLAFLHNFLEFLLAPDPAGGIVGVAQSQEFDLLDFGVEVLPVDFVSAVDGSEGGGNDLPFEDGCCSVVEVENGGHDEYFVEGVGEGEKTATIELIDRRTRRNVLLFHYCPVSIPVPRNH